MIAERMENAKSEPNLGILKQESNNGYDDDIEENKENFAPDKFDDQNIK